MINPLSKISMFLAPLIILGVIAVFFVKVDLTPRITPDFFFSSDSKIYKRDKKIQNEFPFQQQLLLNVTTDNILDPNYIEKIGTLTNRIQSVRGVKDVQSITHGPDDIKAARENPLWRRLLIGKDEKSTFIVAFISTDNFTPLVNTVEKIVSEEENQWFKIHISGLPYIVEQIRRNLTQDMKKFTLGAIFLSALMLLAVFRSLLVVTGALVTCVTAAMLTLIIQSFVGIPIGILTANLGTIVFVLTLSHVIFLISNWCNASDQGKKDVRLSETLKHTFPASFWAAMTTLLGFSSLIFVEAKPLNELGVGGTIGTISALLSAYLIFPAFLRLAKVNPSNFTYALARKFPLPKKAGLILTIIVILTATGLGYGGVRQLDTDPSLLSYFQKDGKLRNGIFYVDENGGSNPLLLVVRQKSGEKLDNNRAYNKMWDLQQAFTAHKEVGSVISLPVIMAEGDEHWLGNLLPWNILLNILSKPKHGGIAKSFISDDRTRAMFMLRMKESGREENRLAIIEDVKSIAGPHGFTVTDTGGTYYLQGELAASVAESMTIGILTLIGLFGVIALIVSASIMVALSVMICATCIAAIVIGTLGVLNVPIDVISSPSINICLGLIVDDMIHLTVTAKRGIKNAKDRSLRNWSAWKDALDTQSWPAIISTLTIMIGFSVFALSDFPPSQRFGLEIVYGAGLAVILALGVFPFIASIRFFKKKT